MVLILLRILDWAKAVALARLSVEVKQNLVATSVREQQMHVQL
jgi:hypothetical protein